MNIGTKVVCVDDSPCKCEVKTKPVWMATPHGGFIATAESENQIIEARYYQGGNNLWSASVSLMKKGRKRKVGIGRMLDKSIMIEMMAHQSITVEEAIAWAEIMWSSFPELK